MNKKREFYNSGYASALSGRVSETLKGLFVSGDSLLISLDSDHDSALDTVSAIPPRKKEILALLKLLKKFSWAYISIVVSNQVSFNLYRYCSDIKRKNEKQE